MAEAGPQDLTDEQLMAQAAGDPQRPAGRAAASELLGRHRRPVYLWCRRYIDDHDRATDLAQDVLLSAYRALASFEGKSKFTSWLYVIARNRCFNAMAAASLPRDDETEPEALPHPDGSPEALLESRQDEERVRRMLTEHLDEWEREAVWLRYYERMPVEEIGRVMRLDAASGARGLLQRARRKLRAALAGQPGEARS